MPGKRPLPEHVIRPFVDGQDDNLIFDSWMRQIARAWPSSRWPRDVWHGHRVAVRRALAASRSIVASYPQSPIVIYGYACGGLTEEGHQVLHMVYVRDPWRGRGLATRLIREVLPHFRDARTYYTHIPRSARRLERPWNMTYHPYMMSQELV